MEDRRKEQMTPIKDINRKEKDMLEGKWVVMSYDEEGWGPSQVQQVFNHMETGAATLVLKAAGSSYLWSVPLAELIDSGQVFDTEAEADVAEAEAKEDHERTVNLLAEAAARDDAHRWT